MLFFYNTFTFISTATLLRNNKDLPIIKFLHKKVVFEKILCGELLPKEQNESEAKYVCKRKPKDGLINWNDTAWNIFILVRALIPPYTEGAFSFYKREKLVISSAELYECPSYISISGQVVARFEGKGVLVKCKDKVLLIKIIIWKVEKMGVWKLFKTVGAILG